MPRTVFFSFHYQRDIFRVQQVRNHYVAKGTYTEAGYFDGSLDEKAKKDGVNVVKGLINRGLTGSSVLCVLIGQETATRHWVYYEILKSLELGMGLFGIRIHGLKNITGTVDLPGANPFYNCGYVIQNDRLVPKIRYTEGWDDAPHLDTLSRPPVPYLRDNDRPLLSDFIVLHDWLIDDGYNNFGSWIEDAARQAARGGNYLNFI